MHVQMNKLGVGHLRSLPQWGRVRKRMKYAGCEQAKHQSWCLLSLVKKHTLSAPGLVNQALSMSEKSDNDFSLDLQFLPEWASDDAAVNKYAGHSGEDRSQRGRSGGRRDDRRGPRRDSGGRDNRRPKGDRDQNRNRDRGPKDSSRGTAPRGGKSGGQSSGRPQRPQVQQLDIRVEFVPDAQGVESIAKEIRLTGRAYPLFQIALLVLERPARYTVNLRVLNKPSGETLQRLFACQLDSTVWLSVNQVVRHVMARHFDQFYATNRVEVDAPNGSFAFVAQCGVTNEYLGPPNHHDYQKTLVSFHAERLPRMPFEKFKSRIRIRKEEEAVNAWLEQVKWKTEFATVKAETARAFAKRDEAEAHFRETHLAGVMAEVETHSLAGTDVKEMRDPRMLAEFLRDQWHRQKHFPMQVSTHLSKIFSSMGLQFFKKDKKVTHVAVAKPNYLDVEAEPVSDGVKKIIQFVETTTDCTRRKILEHLGGLEHVEPKEGEEPPPMPEQTDEQKQLIADIHWLVHQGHMLDFSNGIIETAKKSRKQAEAEENPEPAVKEPATEEPAAEEIVSRAAAASSEEPVEESQEPKPELIPAEKSEE